MQTKHNSIECWVVLKNNENIQVLLFKKTNNKAFPEGFWQPITGDIEFNETPLRACRREVLEESGLKFDLADFIPVPGEFTVHIPQKNRITHKNVFLAIIERQAIEVALCKEHVDCHGVNPENVKEYLRWNEDIVRWEAVETKLRNVLAERNYAFTQNIQEPIISTNLIN